MALLAAVTLVSGCGAEVTTSVRVADADRATFHVQAIFQDEAAAAINSSPSVKAQLLGVFSDRTGKAPSYQGNSDKVEVSQDLTYAQVKSASTVLGLSNVTLNPAGDDTSFSVTVSQPAELAQAIRQANAAQPDAAALSDVMLKSTTLVVDVSFPGGVSSSAWKPDTSAESSTAEKRVGSDSVTLTRTAADTATGTFTVVGDPSPARWPWFLGGSVLLLLGVVAARRYRR